MSLTWLNLRFTCKFCDVQCSPHPVLLVTRPHRAEETGFFPLAVEPGNASGEEVVHWRKGCMHGLPLMLRAQPLVTPFSNIPAVASDLRNCHRARTSLMMFGSVLQVVFFVLCFNMRTLLCLKNAQRSLYFPFCLTSSSAVLGHESTGAAESSRHAGKGRSTSDSSSFLRILCFS